jgi:multiple antibiotic resistance protein
VAHLGSLFTGTFTTLLAIINPLEALPIFLGLANGMDSAARRRLARRACVFAAGLLLFFFVFGNVVLRIFAVPLAMVRMVGGIVLMGIGFSLFMPSDDKSKPDNSRTPTGDPAFVPLAMPIMFGPGAIATIIGMSTTVKKTESATALLAIVLAILATVFVTYLFLAYADRITRRVGPQGIDAVTRLVGFFVATIGMGLIFHGLTEFLASFGIVPKLALTTLLSSSCRP